MAGPRRRWLFLAATGLLMLAGCGGDDDGPAAASPETFPVSYGQAAPDSEATRVVEITMTDEMRFAPDVIEVEEGETVTFRLHNAGELPHEFTIGGPGAHELHELEMASMDMSSAAADHDDDHAQGMDSEGMERPEVGSDTQARIDELEAEAGAFGNAPVAPGETVTLTWTFDGDEAPTFGCHIPGHYDAGMRGRFELV